MNPVTGKVALLLLNLSVLEEELQQETQFLNEKRVSLEEQSLPSIIQQTEFSTINEKLLSLKEVQLELEAKKKELAVKYNLPEDFFQYGKYLKGTVISV